MLFLHSRYLLLNIPSIIQIYASCCPASQSDSNVFNKANRDQVSIKTLSSAFKKARDKSGLKWDSGTEPTFHEQRSLSERLYREQGIDTQKLLGHRTSKMTDKYNDDRGKDWVIIGNKTA